MCFHDQQWSANVVQCSNVSQVPSLLPMDVTALHLERNNLTRLTQSAFLGRSRLKSILLSDSNILEIENGTFSGLDHLEVINLGHNQLKQLFGHEFIGAISLRELYLHHNQLVTIEPDTFKHLSQLTVLRLDGNLLIEFPIWELSANQYLSSLTLASNWWNCECNFVRKFRMFIDTLGNAVVKDARQIACNSDHDKRIGQTSCHAVLPNHHFFAIDTTDNPYTIPVVLGIFGVCMGIMAFLLAFMCYKDKFRLWLYARYGLRIEVSGCLNRPLGNESSILFDALVLYSNKDNEPFVSDFCQNLEPNYRLCLLHRDLSGIYTSEAFKSALAASKRHIVLLSRSFFATEWQHFQEHLPDYQKLILIKLDLDSDNDTEAINEDEAARKFLASASKVLTWSTRQRFWSDIKYYLPEPPRLPTKEGGAELDVSGVWTFNEGNTTRPVKKKCGPNHSTSSVNDSGVYDGQSDLQLASTRSCGTNAVNSHQRSSSALVETIQRVGGQSHQRSKSYLHSSETASVPPSNPNIVTTPTTANKAKMQRPNGTPNYASPPSILMQLAAASPDLLASLNSTMTTPLNSTPSIATPNNVKMLSPVVKAKLKEGHQHQRSTSMLVESAYNRVSPSLTPKTSSKFITNAGRNPHRRSVSVLDPSNVNIGPSNTPTSASASHLVLSNPNLRLLAAEVGQNSHREGHRQQSHHTRSTSMLEGHYQATASSRLKIPSMDFSVASPLQPDYHASPMPPSSRPVGAGISEASAIRLEDLDSRKILNMSTSQLHRLAANQSRMAPKGASASTYHQRSSSTPYEGFVL